MSVMRPELIMKSIIPVVMAGIIAIYGLVVAVLIASGVGQPAEYTLYKWVALIPGSGLSVLFVEVFDGGRLNFQRFRPPRRRPFSRFLWSRRRLRHRHRGRCRCPWYSSAAASLRGNDSYPHLCWSIRSLRSHRGHLPLHKKLGYSFSRLFATSKEIWIDHPLYYPSSLFLLVLSPHSRSSCSMFSIVSLATCCGPSCFSCLNV